jgi:hypothetical protein
MITIFTMAKPFRAQAVESALAPVDAGPGGPRIARERTA